jgi:branched-subunit amino acid aminotransferase/4-amino-4-deoxychorismate lyase
MLVLIDGQPGVDTLSVFDGAVLRGDGCFEAIRSYRGRPFALREHYVRLSRSALALRLPVPTFEDLSSWVAACAADGGDCVVRVVVTRGIAVPGDERPSRCLVLWHPLPAVTEPLLLHPVTAPWHPGGEEWELAGVKTISYAANQAATRRAQDLGADDAVLINRSGVILEGPTFSVAWVVAGRLETPALGLGILESITRGLVLSDCRGLGIAVTEGRFTIDRLQRASEFLALSTVKEVASVAMVGSVRFEGGPITSKLAVAFRERVQDTVKQV